MSQLQDLAAKDRRVSRRMRLVTMSFDPEHDTPQTMRDYAAQFRSAAAAPGMAVPHRARPRRAGAGARRL